MSEQKFLLESQIREIYGRVVYTHKTHEKCADVLKNRNDCFLKLTSLRRESIQDVYQCIRQTLLSLQADGLVFDV